MDQVQRLKYSNGQFLVATDFQDEQRYHVAARWRHNASLHTWGVLGPGDLPVTFTAGATSVMVGPGTAIDQSGREMVLTSPIQVSLSSMAGQQAMVVAQYKELDGATATIGNTSTPIRTIETADVKAVVAPATATSADPNLVNLALVVVDGTGVVTAVHPEARTMAGAVINPGADVAVHSLTTSAGLTVSGPADVGGPVTTHGDLSVGGRLAAAGDAAVAGKLTVGSDAGVAGNLTVTGGTTITGPLTATGGLTSPAEVQAGSLFSTGPLSVNGGATVGGELDVGGSIHALNSDLYFTGTSHSFTAIGEAAGFAAIENDSNAYKTLMILGRKTTFNAGDAAFQRGQAFYYTNNSVYRSVDVWDYLQVNGHARIRGNLLVDGTSYIKKSGYVTDQFVNNLKETLQAGDVVVIAGTAAPVHQGTSPAIPVFEVDLCRSANDPSVCGIVCELFGDGFPGGPATPLGNDAGSVDRSRIAPGQVGEMVTLGAFAWCKVDAGIAPIGVGDLLTTSPTPGHAQKVLDRPEAMGTILGKALAPLEEGLGTIPVLVVLQ